VKGNDKTRLRLKQLSLLIFHYALTGSAQHLRSAINNLIVFLIREGRRPSIIQQNAFNGCSKDMVWATACEDPHWCMVVGNKKRAEG
jgi:hypothetical protein